MGLSKKTFLYSMLLAGVMVILIIGYFVFMLPSLYVDYVMDSNLDSVREIQKGYMEKRSYEDLTVKNPSAVFSVEIPREGVNLYVAGKYFRLTVTVRDEEMQKLLQIFQKKTDFQKMEDWSEADLMGEESRETFRDLWEKIKECLVGENFLAEDYPLVFQLETSENHRGYKEEYGKLHMDSENLLIYEMGVSDGDYEYTTYLALGQAEDAMILTLFPAMTPQMEEIRPIVMGSMPMIAAVVFLFVLVASRMFAGKIIYPIIRLASYAEDAKVSEKYELNPFALDSKDEIGVLSRTLQELYDRLRENYRELEQKNLALSEENERQEVFLRASSHQLKTPVTAALLLVDGMIDDVGKYRNTKEYLPEVRKQLLSMRRIVEDILSLNYHAEHMQKDRVDLRKLVEELADGYGVQAETGELDIMVTGEGSIYTDREMMIRILDNLFSNAVQYTPPGERICVEISERLLRVTNSGAAIEEELLPRVFEPFVSSVENGKGRGLGLYVASYYSRVLGYRLELFNQKDSVCAQLSFEMVEGGRGHC